MTQLEIRPVPMAYAGVEFRSTLEADWAATLDRWGMTGWSYEPLAVDLGGVRYLADFYLELQNTWIEVKGPHNQRIDKPRRLQQALTDDLVDHITPPLVLIMRAPVRGKAVWESAVPGMPIVLRCCRSCEHSSFLNADGDWRCRYCLTHSKPAGDYWSGEAPFERAPRPGIGKGV